jgi:hypothetical protein
MALGELPLAAPPLVQPLRHHKREDLLLQAAQSEDNDRTETPRGPQGLSAPPE